MVEFSPFPTGFLGVELFINGVWTNVTSDLSDDGVQISRGRPDESTEVTPSQMKCRLKNSDGKYSPRNPSSPYYGLIGRNTPVRVYTDLGAPWISLNGTNANLTAPDSAGLSITGDLEIQWEGSMEVWDAKTDILSKYGASGQRSWVLQVQTTGLLTLFWSADGTNLLSASSTVPLPAWGRRLALKVTVDVDNGAAGRTVTFYTSDSINGTWTQFGDAVVTAGTTSFFDSTAAVTLGKNTNTSADSTSQKVYAFKILQGIGGTVRANVTASGLTVGASSFSDGTNTWTVNSPASITKRHYRFWGEVVEWPQKWGLKGAPSAYAEIEASGVLRRLAQGRSVLKSVYRRGFSTIGAADLIGYWPCEDKQNATAIRGTIPGLRKGRVRGTPSLGSYIGFAGSNPLPALGAGRLTFFAPVITPTAATQIRWVGNLPTDLPDNTVYARFRYSNGSIARVDLVWYTASGGQFGFEAYDDENNQIVASLYGSNLLGKKARWSFELSQSGSDVSRTLAYYELGATTGFTVTTTITGQSIGRIYSADFNPILVDVGETAIGHVTFEKAITTLFDVSKDVINGYAGYTGKDWISRLSTENNMTVTALGGEGVQGMDGQRADTVLNLIRSAARTDGGVLYEPRNADDLAFRSIESMYSQPPLAVTYTDNLLLPFEPVDDDQATRNSVTVTRDLASSATEELTSGPLSIQVPPNGVGLYDEDVTLSLQTDDQAIDQASWRLHIGTHDEARWPVIGFNLAHPTFLGNAITTQRILELDLGDRLDVSDLPSWLPPDDVSVILQGYDEEITPFDFRIEWNTTPARPYRVARYNDPNSRYSGAGTVTAEALDTTETGVDVTNPAGLEWTIADGSYDIVIGGERMTVTGVTGTGTAQTLTVTRSVNGVVKSHLTGAAVDLADPVYYGL